MNIAIDARSAVWYKGTGMGTYTGQLVENILSLDKKNSYDLLLPHNIWSDDLPKYNINSNISDFWERVHKCPFESKGYVDIVHIPHNGIGVPVSDQNPCIVTIHDLIPYILPDLCGKKYKDIFVNNMPDIVAKASHIIAVSENTKKDIVRLLHVPDDKITVISEGASKIFTPMDKEMVGMYLRRKYHIKKDYLLYIGGFNQRKNVKSLLVAFSRLVAECNKDLALVLVGQKGKQYDELVSLAKSLNIFHRLIFTGFVSQWELPYFYNGASVFVYPSIYEGFGLPPLEAMSCGTPTVVYDNSSLREIVAGGGLLINGDEISLANSICQILEDSDFHFELSQKAYEHSKQFSWERVAVKTIELYSKVNQEVRSN